MLIELRIRDFAIIDQVDLTFDQGFTVLTGETGAGKSILIDAVELLLGGRADSSLVRTGTNLAILEGTFQLEQEVQPAVHAILERESLLDDKIYVTLGREIKAEGRNVCRVNGRVVTLAVLSEIGRRLVDVHGQSEHLSLLRVGEHLSLLDRFAQVDGLLQEYQRAHLAFHKVRQERQALEQLEQQAAQRSDMLRFQIEEIEAAALSPGEVAPLMEERNRLANAEQLVALAEQAILALDEGRDAGLAANDLLGEAAHAIGSLAALDPSMRDVKDQTQVLVEQAGELAGQLRKYREEIEFNSRRLDEVEERLILIRSLQRKYGEDIQEILDHAASARVALDQTIHAEERLMELRAEEARRLETLGRVGEQLSHARQAAGERLAKCIEAELDELHMQGAQFEVARAWRQDPGGVPAGGGRVAFHARGLDQVEFLVAPNPGEGCKPLVKIASGGETSRLMLGMKSVLSKADPVPTLIFDEIDQGIGGRIGAVVGEKLWRLAGAHQVFCVTHLPQLAAFGDAHFRVEKVVDEGRTRTHVQRLEMPQRIAELALMLGGDSEANLESALDLSRAAQHVKHQSQALA